MRSVVVLMVGGSSLCLALFWYIIKLLLVCSESESVDIVDTVVL